MSFSDLKMYNDLIKQGCLPCKSLILKSPKIKKDLIRHFIRGYVDGDGCLSFSDKNPFCLTISIIGTEDILNYIYKKIFGNYPSKLSGDNRYNNEYTKIISFNREDSRIAAYILYENSNIYLQRKFDKYLLTKTAVLNRDIQYYDRVKSVKSEMIIPR